MKPTKTITNQCAKSFAHLAQYIQEEINEHGKNVVFRIGQIKKMYTERLNELLGRDQSVRIPEEHTTRLRTQILDNFPEIKKQFAGREYILMHNSANVLQNIILDDQEEDALAFHRFVRKMRMVISATRTSFHGSFSEKAKETAVTKGI